MSTNAPQTQRPGDDPWNPRRIQAGFRRVRLVGHGKNRHYEFNGQQTGETVELVLRKHIWFLITPAFPVIGSFIALIAVTALKAAYPQAGALWTLLQILFGILIVITLFLFLYKDLALWWVEVSIITNRRVIVWKGLFNPTRKEATLEQVVQTTVNQDSLWSQLLSYGDVHLNLIGGRGLAIEKVPNPKKVRDRFTKVLDDFRRSKPAAEAHSVPVTPDLHQVLAQLSKKEPLPKELQLPPNPDKKYRHREDEEGHIYPPDNRTRGPLRTFGGPLRLPCSVAYTADEDTVMYIQRAKSVLVLRLLWRVLVLIALIILTFLFPSLALSIIIAILVWLLFIVYTILNYIDDVFILTTKRVIDIDRKFLFFSEEHITAEYSNIRDVTVNVGNAFFLALDVGTIIVQTPGDNPNIEISPADHPFSIQDMIYNLKGRKEKVDKLKAKNDQKEVLHQWFGTVLATMENTVLGRGVPNLLRLDYFEAAERARAANMRVVLNGEDPSYPNIESGLIVSQDPIPGTLIQFDPHNYSEWPVIRVKLSSRVRQA
jgi:hypothetical protein